MGEPRRDSDLKTVGEAWLAFVIGGFAGGLLLSVVLAALAPPGIAAGLAIAAGGVTGIFASRFRAVRRLIANLVTTFG